jgi:hypothetical protein
MSGAIKSICSACGEAFISVAAFDFHRVGPYLPGTRRCLTVSEMQAEGLLQDEQGCWGFAPGHARPDQATFATRYGRSAYQYEKRSNA